MQRPRHGATIITTMVMLVITQAHGISGVLNTLKTTTPDKMREHDRPLND
jgi:hypothetical protein